jgi:hypothetical protein
MKTDRRRERDGGGMMVAALVPIVLVLLLVFYVASTGPVIRLCILAEYEDIALVYAPLEWLCDSCPPVEEWLSAYVEWWVDDLTQ